MWLYYESSLKIHVHNSATYQVSNINYNTDPVLKKEKKTDESF